MNRRHTAYCMTGNAVRFSLLMGLHLNLPQHHLLNRELHEHRTRVWWSVYILDRNWASMLGQPVSINDDEISVELPSLADLSGESAEVDFADPD